MLIASELIERYAKSHGLQIPDALIAATALNHNLKLYTGNKNLVVARLYRHAIGLNFWCGRKKRQRI